MAGPIRISILANGRQARREADLTARAYSGVGRTLSKLGAAAGLGLLTAKAVGFAKESVNLEAKFSQTMNLVGAATKAPATQIQSLTDLAMKLGADTAFSANEAADAMLELAKAGLDTKTIMGGGLAGTLTLAAAGGTELGTAATIASNAINTFNLAGKDMESVAAALAGGANASSASVESLGQALQQVGPGATNAGLSLQETVAALSAFDSAGVKGSDAGTSLKTMLTRLVPQTEKAASSMERLGLDFVKGNGEFESLTNIADQLQKKLSGLSAAQRTTALATIFGSDASRAATVLMKEGADGIKKYIKATNDQNAAQRMAETRMSGTAGALERLSGSVETAQLALGRELAPVIQSAADGLADRLVPAMEAGIEGAKEFGRAVEPAVSAVIDVLEDLIPSADGTASVFNDQLIPAVRTLSDIVAGTVGFIDDLPGPVKEVGVQAGIAALVLPRLTAGVTSVTGAVTLNVARLKQWRAEMTYTELRAQRLTATTARLGAAARTAAGIGGMVALTQSAGKAGTAMGVLGTTAGGAALGFSVAGPLGAAVGGMAGAIYSMTRNTDGASQSFRDAKQPAVDFSGALDQITGAADKGIRSLALLQLQQDGAVEAASMLGISTRDLVGFMLDQEGATARVQGALAATRGEAERYYRKSGEASEVYQLLNGRIEHFNDTVAGSKAELQSAQQATRENALATMALGKVFKGLPKKAITRIRTEGIPETTADVRSLARQFKLTPKQIRTVIRQSGAETTVRAVQRVIDKTKDVGKAKPDLGPFQRLFKTGMDRVKTDATLGGLATGKALKNTTAKARPDLNPFTQMFNAGLNPAKTSATTGGNQIGGNLKAGVIGGFAGTQSALAAAASAAVRGAIAAARAAAKIKSPSREMAYIGEMMGEGLARGMEKKKKRNRGAGGTLVKAILKDVGKGLDGLTRLIEKKTKEARGKALLGRLKDEYAGLRKVGQALDKNDRRLEKAVSKHKQLVQEAKAYAKNIKDSAVAYGSVVGLGLNQETGIVSTAGLLSDLANRAVQVERYAALVQQLKAAGLNKTTIQQLLDAGVDGGLATAEAIAAGGASAIGQINTLTSQIATTGGALGDKMSKTFFGAGVKAAEGIVKGLERKEKQLDKVAERLAQSLVKKVKDALGIKSPSRVFADIGTRTVEGLAIGLDETYVRRAGSRLAGSLQQGFGQPALDAYMSSSASSSQQTMTIHLTAEELSAIEHGRRITAKVDAYRAAGGRVRA